LFVSSKDFVVDGTNYAWLKAYIQFPGGTPATADLILYPAGAPYDVWRTVTVQTTVEAGNAGKDMQILLQGAGVWVDNVRLTRGAIGYPATVIVNTNPTGVSVTPAAGTYTVPLGTTIGFIGDSNAVACPKRYSFDHWSQGGRLLRRPQVRSQTIIIDNDITVMAEYEDVSVCGDVCHLNPLMDLSGNCIVDFEDFSKFAEKWLVDFDSVDLGEFAEEWLVDTRP
jgi:hypothetical protein